MWLAVKNRNGIKLGIFEHGSIAKGQFIAELSASAQILRSVLVIKEG
jgi:hypothetical protein